MLGIKELLLGFVELQSTALNCSWVGNTALLLMSRHCVALKWMSLHLHAFHWTLVLPELQVAFLQQGESNEIGTQASPFSSTLKLPVAPFTTLYHPVAPCSTLLFTERHFPLLGRIWWLAEIENLGATSQSNTLFKDQPVLTLLHIHLINTNFAPM